jgi:hypothetical protein
LQRLRVLRVLVHVGFYWKRLKFEGTPDARIFTEEEALFAGEVGVVVALGIPDRTVFHEDACADGAFVGVMSVGGEGGGPGDVAMAGGIEGVAGFAEDPFGAVERFAQGEESAAMSGWERGKRF